MSDGDAPDLTASVEAFLANTGTAADESLKRAHLVANLQRRKAQATAFRQSKPSDLEKFVRVEVRDTQPGVVQLRLHFPKGVLPRLAAASVAGEDWGRKVNVGTDRLEECTELSLEGIGPPGTFRLSVVQLLTRSGIHMAYEYGEVGAHAEGEWVVFDQARALMSIDDETPDAVLERAHGATGPSRKWGWFWP